MSLKPKTLVYLGGSYPQKCAIQAIQSVGIKIALVDRDENALCGSIADFFIQSDVTDKAKILNEVRELQSAVDVIGAYGVADYAFSSVGRINEFVNSKGVGAGEFYKFTNKLETKKYIAEENLKTPRLLWSGTKKGLREIDSIAKECGCRNVVVKGVDQNNSRGVSLLQRPDPGILSKALGVALESSDEVLVEELVDGTVTNVDGLMIDSVFFPVSTTRRRNSLGNEQICEAMIQPAELWPGFEQEMFALAEQCAHALGYAVGPITIDVIADAKKGLHVIEASPHFHCIQNDFLRGGGQALVAYAQYLAGDPRWCENLLPPPAKYGVCVQQFSESRGVIQKMDDAELLRSNPLVRDVCFLKKEGDVLSPEPGSQTLIALIWAVSDDIGCLELFMDSLNENFSVIAD